LAEAEPVAVANMQVGGGAFWLARGWIALARGDVVGAEAMFRTAAADRRPAWHIRQPIGFGAGDFAPELAAYWLGVALLRRGDTDRSIRLMAAARRSVERGYAKVAAMEGRRRGDDTVAEARAA